MNGVDWQKFNNYYLKQNHILIIMYTLLTRCIDFSPAGNPTRLIHIRFILDIREANRSDIVGGGYRRIQFQDGNIISCQELVIWMDHYPFKGHFLSIRWRSVDFSIAKHNGGDILVQSIKKFTLHLIKRWIHNEIMHLVTWQGTQLNFSLSYITMPMSF